MAAMIRLLLWVIILLMLSAGAGWAATTTRTSRPVVEIFVLGNPELGKPAMFKLTRTGDTGDDLVVKLRTMEGGLADPKTYRLPEKVTIPKDKKEVQFEVATVDDGTPQWTRGFAVEIVPDEQYVCGKFDCDGAEIIAGNIKIRIAEAMAVDPVELTRLDLIFPTSAKNGAAVTVSVDPGGCLRVWDNMDRSGRLLIDKQRPSYTWHIGQDKVPLPHILWVEATALAPDGKPYNFSLSIDEKLSPAWKHFPQRLAKLYPDAVPKALAASQPTSTKTK